MGQKLLMNPYRNCTMTNRERTALIVDDSSTNVILLENIMAHQGFATLTACDGEEALELMKKYHPDIILLDIMMPGINGFEFMEMIKQDQANKDIPVIFVTARKDVESQEKGMAMGAADYIVKPITLGVVLEKVNKALSNGRFNAAI